MKRKIAVAYISTNKYVTLFEDFYKSFSNNFLCSENVTYLIFTDAPDITQGKENTITIPIPQENYKMTVFKKFFYILSAGQVLENFDYIIYMNGNARCVREVNFDDLFGGKDQYACLHGTYEWKRSTRHLISSLCINPESEAYFNIKDFKEYLQASNMGASKDKFIEMAKTIEEWRIKDFQQNLQDSVPWHDETYYNKYLNTISDLSKVTILKNGYNVPMNRKTNRLRFYPKTKIIMEDKIALKIEKRLE